MKATKRAFFTLVLFILSTSCTSTSHHVVRTAPPGSVVGIVTMDGFPLPGATVSLESVSQPKRVAVTDANGSYSFLAVPPGMYTLRTELVGLLPETHRVNVTAQNGVALLTDMRLSSVSETITVTAASSGDLQWLPAQPEYALGRAQTVTQNAPTIAPATYVEDAIQEVQVDATGKEHGFVDTKDETVATFAIDVDRASYANIRRHLLAGVRPPPSSVRIEEMLNYFTYNYPQPSSEVPFSVTTEVASCPWNASNRLVRVGIQGRNLDQWKMAPNNLVFLLDVSGSMDTPYSLPMIQQSFRVLVNELRAEDRVAIVVYAGAAGLVLPSTSGADKMTILHAIDVLQAGGSTAGGAGIELAYKVAQDHFIANGNNRVILATDGDFNVGASTPQELEDLITKKRDSGIFLSVIGVGDMSSDHRMELLADKGNGNYAFLDSLSEADKVFRRELTGTLVTIAKDVKVQLEWDANAVKSYRQIGYENRALAKKDFEDDSKDAGELGAGHSVTALFEVVPASPDPKRLATLRLRYKDPDGKTSKPLLAEITDEGKSTYESSPDLQFAAAVAELGMLLRDSPHKGTATWKDVLALAKVAQGADLDGTRTEFVTLAQKAQGLK